MKKAIGIIILGLLWCGNVNAEEKFLFSSCDAFGFGIGGVVEINLSKKYMKGRFGEGGAVKKVKIKGEEGVYIVSKKFVVKRDGWKGLSGYLSNTIVTANYKYGEITQRYYYGTYFTHQRSAICERVNNELTAHGEARAKAKQAKKPKTVAKKPKEKKPEKKKPEKKKPKPDDGKIIIIGSGSGFFVSDQGHIVSNEHVIGVCKKVKAYEEGVEVFLNILATDNVNDIGLVKGKFKNKQYLNIKTDGAELGEQIVAFGYPLSQDLSDSVKLTLGIVSSLSGPDNNYSQIQIDAAIQPGNSGGPVLNMNGLVVGIASAGLSKLYMAAKAAYIPENVNFAVAAHSLTSFLKANKVKVTSGPTRIYSTKELAKIGEPATIQLFCMNTREAYAKLKKANKHSDVLLDLQ